ncbi:Membrane frizzled-related protein [Amphibalanus amphitrite]|uniref:Membrane frizzled-related protein n=1 Tax=Amphibalanus amphitrite TaxID=1232801 RepID=A0A6A4XD66_AMPAM|nr:Membrane frizzled-related protein [Amphibalanus amphitrite]
MLGRCWISYDVDIRQSFGGVYFGLTLKLTPLAESERADIAGSGLISRYHGVPGARLVVTNHYTPPSLLTAKGGVGAERGRHVQLEVWKEEHDLTAERTSLLGGRPDCVAVPREAPGGSSVPVAGADSCTVHALRQLYRHHCGCRHLGLDWPPAPHPNRLADPFHATASTSSTAGTASTATSPTSVEEPEDRSLPICSPLQTLTCCGRLVAELVVNVSSGQLPCAQPCVADDVRVYASQEPRPDTNHTTVYVYFTQITFTRFIAVVPGVLEWARDLGGVAGLCLGMSLLSLGEVVLMVVECSAALLRTAAERFRRHRRRVQAEHEAESLPTVEKLAEQQHQQYHQCPLGRCLKRDSVCDGVVDCADGSDEQQCSSAA